MKNLILIFTILYLCITPQTVYSKEKESPYKNNIVPFEEAINLNKPIILAIIKEQDKNSLERISQIYKTLNKGYKNEFNFTILKYSNFEYNLWVRKFSPTCYPSLYIVNPSDYSYIYIPEDFYSKNELKKFINAYKKGTLK